MQIQAEPGSPPGDLVLPPHDVEPVLHELLPPLWINFEKSCKKGKSFLLGHCLGKLIMPDFEIHSKGDFQQDLTQLYAHVHTPAFKVLSRCSKQIIGFTLMVL